MGCDAIMELLQIVISAETPYLGNPIKNLCFPLNVTLFTDDPIENVSSNKKEIYK